MRYCGAALVVALMLSGCGTVAPRAHLPTSLATPPSPDSALASVARASTPSPEMSGIRIMPSAAYSLDARIELSRRAERSLDIQYYLIQNDRTGRLLLRTVRDAAKRGVRVRLLVDDLYTFGADDMFVGLAAFPNIEVRYFNPFCCGRDGLWSKYAASLLDFSRLNHRMHNKLFVADSTIVVAGGRNIADEYFARSMSGNFVDMDALIVGAVVPRLVGIFDAYWNSAHAYPIAQIVATGRTPEELQQAFDRLVDEGDQMLAVSVPPTDILGYGPITDELAKGSMALKWAKARAFADSPDKVRAKTREEARSMSATMNVFDLVVAARDRVVLSSPYFVPGRMGTSAFAELRKRDVGVTILTNSLASNDEPLVHTGYSRYRRDLLQSGVDLYELSPTRVLLDSHLGLAVPGASLGRLHAKTAVIDNHTVFIGSMNLDPRSDSTNTELGIIIESPELAQEVMRVIDISKRRSAYRVKIGSDGYSLEWHASDDAGDVVLHTEPDASLFLRLRNMLFAPFVPEQEL